MKVIQDSQHGNGNIIGTMLIGELSNHIVKHLRGSVTPFHQNQGLFGNENHLLEKEQKVC
jgi:hypothetical protein